MSIESDHECDSEGHQHENKEVAAINFESEKIVRFFAVHSRIDPKTDPKIKAKFPKGLYEIAEKQGLLGSLFDKLPKGDNFLAFLLTKNGSEFKTYVAERVELENGKIVSKKPRLLMTGDVDDLDEEGEGNFVLNTTVVEIRAKTGEDWNGTYVETIKHDGEGADAKAKAWPHFHGLFPAMKASVSPMTVAEASPLATITPENRAELVAKYGETAIAEAEAGIRKMRAGSKRKA